MTLTDEHDENRSPQLEVDFFGWDIRENSAILKTKTLALIQQKCVTAYISAASAFMRLCQLRIDAISDKTVKQMARSCVISVKNHFTFPEI